MRHGLSDEERIDWLRLIRAENVGPITFARLIDRYGSAAAAIDALPALAQRGGRAAPIVVPGRDTARREIDALARGGGRLLAVTEPGYPAALAAIDDAPPLISVIGDTALLDRPAIAVVGARNASLNGRRFAAMLARDLAEAGLLVVSGLARGIDTAAHDGALAGGTAAVLAGGIDVVYPPENDGLYRRIADGGVLIAESALGTQPTARHFPRRNRIISGLSLGVVVVEAALRSGSLITARQALDQGREVFAVPGSPLDPRARGANDLLRQGATLVESAADVTAAIAAMARPRAVEPRAAVAPRLPGFESGGADISPDRAHHLVLAALGPSPVAVDELVRECQLSAAAVLAAILELELAGRAHRHPGNRVALTAEPAETAV